MITSNVGKVYCKNKCKMKKCPYHVCNIPKGTVNIYFMQMKRMGECPYFKPIDQN